MFEEGPTRKMWFSKQKDAKYTSSRLLLPKKGEGYFIQFKKQRSTSVAYTQTLGVRSTRGKPNSRNGFFRGASE